jgi:hypothetical protein
LPVPYGRWARTLSIASLPLSSRMASQGGAPPLEGGEGHLICTVPIFIQVVSPPTGRELRLPTKSDPRKYRQFRLVW